MVHIKTSTVPATRATCEAAQNTQPMRGDMKQIGRHQVLAALTCALAVFVLARCTVDQSASPNGTASPSRALPAPIAVFVASKGALARGVPRAAWVATVHTAAMQEVMRDVVRLRTSSKAVRCARIEEIARAQIPAIQASTGLTDVQLYDQAVAAAMTRVKCPSTSPLSVFGSVGRATHRQEAGVTGEFQAYSGALEAALVNSATAVEAEAALNSVSSQASALPAPDFEVLAGIAGQTASSAYYWYDVQQSGGAPPGADDGREFSIFMEPVCRWWCRVGWSDLFGSVAGALAVVYTAGPGVALAPQTVLIGAAIGGIVNSATSAL